MKNSIIGIAVFAISLAACNSGSNKSDVTQTKNTDSVEVSMPTKTEDKNVAAPIKEIVTSYLQIKNGLASDNGKDAAVGGAALMEAIAKTDKSSMTGAQKKVYEDMADDAKEMAEHISTNADKLEHQREHFDMLSTDMYEMVKTFGAGQALYQDFCPMYNNNKGATWLSETKEIKNPYMGKKQPTCGSVKEEIK